MKKIYLIAAVVALAVGVATYFFASELKTSKAVTGTEHVTVVIANVDIEKETVLTKDMFTEKKVPVDSVLNGAVKNIAEVEGYIATQKIFVGEQLMSQKLALVGAGESNDRLSYELLNGTYAYSIFVDKENAVSYFLREGDRVNIYSDIEGQAPSTTPVLENIEVIRVGEYITAEGVEESAAYEIVTLVLTKEQIPKMMELESPDSMTTPQNFRIVLVPQAEVLGVENEPPAVNEPVIIPEAEEETTPTVPAEQAA